MKKVIALLTALLLLTLLAAGCHFKKDKTGKQFIRADFTWHAMPLEAMQQEIIFF